MCGTRERLPQSYILESSLSILNKHPVASGGSGDIYQGSLKDLSVCVKRLRIYAGEETRGAKKTFYREAVMWKRLAHPNIVPLLGITLEPLQLISTWMPGGELKEYITHHLDTDRLSLLSGIADGLNYLHSRNIVHGDLKGPNILVDDSGCPRITDFGLAMVAQNQDSIRSAEGEHGHTARWTAPEILNEQGTYSKEADVFSFAMVMVEAFTGQVPFHPNLPSAAMLAILDQKRPARPTHSSLTDELWALMKCCWNQEPHDRPEMSVVLKTLRG
ncbi:kinase-like protein [Thelephora ganbajun]|uniref:Kinase-like protein n=1 Tax=Thelephora ganbajun TaxID=370292 RepID=A0ACB6ZN49_THEGA|nr:kinase-like protein [Thelephora ganbajun]